MHRLARACSVGRGLGVAWAWRGRGLGVAWAWRGVGVAWAWRGHGVCVAGPWRGRGVGMAWAWRGRGLGMAWYKSLLTTYRFFLHLHLTCSAFARAHKADETVHFSEANLLLGHVMWNTY